MTFLGKNGKTWPNFHPPPNSCIIAFDSLIICISRFLSGGRGYYLLNTKLKPEVWGCLIGFQLPRELSGSLYLGLFMFTWGCIFWLKLNCVLWRILWTSVRGVIGVIHRWWYCIYKTVGEAVDHFQLHSLVAKVVEFFSTGISWVMQD